MSERAWRQSVFTKLVAIMLSMAAILLALVERRGASFIVTLPKVA